MKASVCPQHLALFAAVTIMLDLAAPQSNPPYQGDLF